MVSGVKILERAPSAFGLGFGKNDVELPPEDPRDKNFHMSSVFTVPKTMPSYRYWWANGWWGNQLSTPQCVAYTGLHLLEDGPITHAPRAPGQGPVINPYLLYKELQRNDEWPGENYDGTSVRALMKVLRRDGYIGSYHWAWDLDTVIDYLRVEGPVGVGTWWYYDMFFPDPTGLIHIRGGRVGGHAYLLNGVNVKRKIVRFKNSWGRGWGRLGHGYMTFDSLARLIQEDGEAAIATELQPAV